MLGVVTLSVGLENVVSCHRAVIHSNNFDYAVGSIGLPLWANVFSATGPVLMCFSTPEHISSGKVPTAARISMVFILSESRQIKR